VSEFGEQSCGKKDNYERRLWYQQQHLCWTSSTIGKELGAHTYTYNTIQGFCFTFFFLFSLRRQRMQWDGVKKTIIDISWLWYNLSIISEKRSYNSPHWATRNGILGAVPLTGTASHFRTVSILISPNTWPKTVCFPSVCHFVSFGLLWWVNKSIPGNVIVNQ
jgi:hypothetical protein